MAVAPGVYARNRLFAFHKHPDVRRAKARAAILRGLVRQLSGLQGATSGLVIERTQGRAVVRYRVDSLRFERRTELSEVEAACLLYLAGRAGAGELRATAEDRALLHATLHRLTGSLGSFAGTPQPPRSGGSGAPPGGWGGPPTDLGAGLGELLDEV